MHSLAGVSPYIPTQPETLMRSLVSSWWLGVSALIQKVTTSWFHLPAVSFREPVQVAPVPQPRRIAPGLFRLESEDVETWEMPWPVPPE
jgi:hypothetical protein